MWEAMEDKVTDTVFRMEETEAFQESVWVIGATRHDAAPRVTAAERRGDRRTGRATRSRSRSATAGRRSAATTRARAAAARSTRTATCARRRCEVSRAIEPRASASAGATASLRALAHAANAYRRERIPMRWLLDALYLSALTLLSPWLAYRAVRTGRYRRGLAAKLLGLSALARRRPAAPSGSTASASAKSTFCDRSSPPSAAADPICRASSPPRPTPATTRPAAASPTCPSSSSRSISPGRCAGRCAGSIRPWSCWRRASCGRTSSWRPSDGDVPVAVINGRMSPRSAARYRRLRWADRPAVRLHRPATPPRRRSTPTAVRSLGAAPRRVHVTGSVKYDGATGDRRNPRTEELRRLLNVTADDLVWVAGSTMAPEEEIVLGVYQRARQAHPNLRLFLAPRQPDRFDEAADVLRRAGVPFVRRTSLDRRRRIAAPWCWWTRSANSAPCGAWRTWRSWAAAWTAGAAVRT